MKKQKLDPTETMSDEAECIAIAIEEATAELLRRAEEIKELRARLKRISTRATSISLQISDSTPASMILSDR